MQCFRGLRTQQGRVGRSLSHRLRWMCVQCVYADMRGNVLVHSKVPALGLHAVQWAVVSWAASQKQRETVSDAKYFYRCHSEPLLT